MKQILIIRFGALGDLCLLAWSLSRFAATSEGSGYSITLVTKAAFAPLMEQVRGIDRVVPLPVGGIGRLNRLAGNLRAQDYDVIIDAHNVLRSHLLLALMGRHPNSRLVKHTAARLALLGLRKNHRHLDTTMSQRFDALFDPLVRKPADQFPAPLFPAPLAELGVTRSDNPSPLGLAPGAQWDSKRWPEEKYAEFLREFCHHNRTPVQIFLGPRENRWYPDSRLAREAKMHAQVEVVSNPNLVEVAALLADCSSVITNDSGLLHLAEAVGTPVLAFFGPTVRQFGYFPRLESSRVLEVEMDCRPCSRNGKRACHRGDLACLNRIEPARVLATLNEMSRTQGKAP